RKVVTVVRLADLGCENQGIGSGGEKADEIEDLWGACNLRPEEMTDELRIIKQEVVATRETFGFRREDTGKGLSRRRSAIELEGVSFSEPQKVAANERRGQVIRFPAYSDYSPKAGQNPPSKRLTILVVEDHGSLCEMLSLYLIRCGYHVQAADNGKVALDVLSKESVDLVLLDLMLPRMDGFTLLKRVRETHEDTRPYIIVIPVGASEKDRNRVLELGANEYMPKPFHMARLLERIQAVEKYLLN
ncbi:MAG TPA: response regulator, partial [Candidatus Binatia bacterium]